MVQKRTDSRYEFKKSVRLGREERTGNEVKINRKLGEFRLESSHGKVVPYEWDR